MVPTRRMCALRTTGNRRPPWQRTGSGAGVVRVRHIAGDSNPADLFTKILTRQPFEKHRKFVLNLPGNSGVDQTRADAARHVSSQRDGTGAP